MTDVLNFVGLLLIFVTLGGITKGLYSIVDILKSIDEKLSNDSNSN